jgi:hypothetical protein
MTEAHNDLEGVPATVQLSTAPPRKPRVRRLRPPSAPFRFVLLLSLSALVALVTVRGTLRFHTEYNLLTEARREGIIYWHTVCDEGRTRPPNSYDQCTRAKTAAHQFIRFCRFNCCMKARLPVFWRWSECCT